VKRLITFLGTGNYVPARYQWAGQVHETCYVADAIARFTGTGEVVALATPEARQRHGEGLRRSLPEGLEITFVAIPNGQSEQELWQQFEAVCRIIRESPDSVVLDITHGYRAQPFFAAASLALLNASDLLPGEMQILYGEYRQAPEPSPIWDLSPFLDLLAWSQGTAILAQTGNGVPLMENLRQQNQRVCRDLARSGSRRFPGTHGLINAIDRFTRDLASVRIASLITGYEQDDNKKAQAVSSAGALVEAIETCREDARTYLPALEPLLDRLHNMARDLDSPSLYGKQGQRAMARLAELYLELQRLPEAAVVLREGWISACAEGPEGVEVNSPAFDKKARDKAEALWFERNTGLAKSIGDIRNDIEHGGFRKQPMSATRLIEQIRSWVGRFRSSTEKQTP